ncbi:MAG TPA: hypothetical protein VGR28_11230 [Candidatus Thermoplasmatota archaeon]|nr:hypothetical protein [Candidatus Thermoplasmatota archaeon]
MLEERIASVRADRTQGSGALADEALAILGEAAGVARGPRFLVDLGAVARALARAKPAMVAIDRGRLADVADRHARRAAAWRLDDAALARS